MQKLIAQLWEHLRNAGYAEVMLFLPDGSACRCHWDQTAMLGDIRVALLGDQERNIVRIVPLNSCTGIGIAPPKGTDPGAYRASILVKLDPTRAVI